MAIKKNAEKEVGLSINPLQQTEVSFKIIGTAPLIYN